MKTRVFLFARRGRPRSAPAPASAQLRERHGRDQRFRRLPRRRALRRRARHAAVPERYRLDIGDDVNYGGRLGYNFTNLFEVELEYARTPTHLEVDPFRSNLPNVTLSATSRSSTTWAT